ncbi:hypothetical protein XA68_14366 [Ophiocordyceps unilateralis]|uniref:Uncharacterized protein n=1 Tax=Ophiocordyceps unilateralis TaxID=268505 RepID=A0A2A9PAA9_OPHUN|nr:hypothetical protein XA68_14366 [Ophiocordyceps unilateralis]
MPSKSASKSALATRLTSSSAGLFSFLPNHLPPNFFFPLPPACSRRVAASAAAGVHVPTLVRPRASALEAPRLVSTVVSRRCSWASSKPGCRVCPGRQGSTGPDGLVPVSESGPGVIVFFRPAPARWPRQGPMPTADGTALPSHPPPKQSPTADSASAPSPAVGPSHLSAPRSLEGTFEYRELVDVVLKTAPDVLRQVMRDRWDKCLSGSDYHHRFILDRILPSATPSVLALAVQKSGEKMVRASKNQILAHLTTQDMDELADMILAKASDDFLDKAMARRLETIRARRLVNALARAERLGYDVRDIVEENSANGTELVVPSAASRAAFVPPRSSQSLQPQASTPIHQAGGSPAHTARNVSYPAPAKSSSPHGLVHCTRCGRPCSGDQAFRYHAQKRACEHSHKVDRVGIDVCPHCGCFFTGSGGLLYHIKSKVCGDYNGATEQAVMTELRSRPRRPYSSDLAVSSASSPAAGATQLKSSAQPVGVAANRNGLATPSRMSEDPYAKLTPEARRNFEQEMLMAEEKYGGMMRNAMSMPEHEREDYLQRIKNSYNSKQSTTRKKYGIRLRERRSKAEIEEERNRLLNAAPPAKRSRPNETNKTPVDSRNGTPLSAFGLPTGPSGLSGGLVETPGQAELVDPTTLLKQPGPRIPSQTQVAAPVGTSEDPMQVEDSSSTDEDEDDDDIPARLPALFPA